MIIGGGKTKALRNQRRREQRQSPGPSGSSGGGKDQEPADRPGKAGNGNLLRRLLGKGRREE